MKKRKLILVCTAMLVCIPLLVCAGDVTLTADGKVPGQPFNSLQQQVDELGFDLDNIQLIPGSQGPQGEPGAPGPAGPQGEPGGMSAAGQSCPDGAYLSGFDAGGNIICSGVN